MPEKDPSLWIYLANMPASLQGAAMAFIIAYLRIVYDRKEATWLRRLAESLICGLLAFSFHFLIVALGMSEGLSVFIGALIGFLGADFVREKASNYVSKKAEE
jgi:lambda family phage holin